MASLMLVNPKRKRRKARRNTKAAANPRRRRRSTRRRARRNPVAMANPRRRRSTRRRSSRLNPKFSIRSIQKDAIMPAAIGGVGALALDVAFGALPIPATFKTGAMGSLAKLAGAIILGKLAGKALGGKVGEAVTVGAVTIQAYNLVKGFAQKAMPTLPMGEYLSGVDGAFPHYEGQPSLGYMNAGEYVAEPYSGEMGEYLSDTDYNENY